MEIWSKKKKEKIMDKLLEQSVTINKYKDTMKRSIFMYYPQLSNSEVDNILNYSIQKRFKNHEASIDNNYEKFTINTTLLELSDYIATREPILTAHGTMFKRHGTVPNPLAKVIQSFLDLRSQHKKMMFTFPKGSEDFEKYNLLQSLDKIDCNAIYGAMGLFSSIIYNENVASSITTQGRALVSSAGMVFESFLANNVKFGSLNEIMTFIDNVCQEKYTRKYSDSVFLDKDISVEDCFAKLILTCGFRWVPDEKDMEIVWKCLNTLCQEDINRIYYKNNLYEFMSNSSMIKSIRFILAKLEKPYMFGLNPPDEIRAEMDELTSVMMEYVYYGYQIIDRIDRMSNMIKSVCLISDTDSTFISMDAWYRFTLENVKDMRDINILKYSIDPIYFLESDEFGDITDKRWKRAITFEEPNLDYDFFTDEVIELEKFNNPIKILPQDNLRYSIISILAYVLDKVINSYMEKFTMNNHSYRGKGFCKIIMKQEFNIKRALLTSVKKSYASVQELQEGNRIEAKESTALDIKGIASMAKSSMAESTRNALKHIMYEDILNCEEVDQLKVIKKLAILEKKIINSLYDGSKEFYKPLTVKAMSVYADPMGQQGVKASIVWNNLRDPDMEVLNLDERNAIDVAKIVLNSTTRI